MKRVRTATVLTLTALLAGTGQICVLNARQEAPPTSAEAVIEGERTDEASADSAARRALDTIHEDLVQLRFEQALAGIGALLASTELSEDERTEALVLRAQGHVAFGDLKAAEQDYREILALRPAFVPDPSMTPRKATERFEKVQASLIGRLLLQLTPADARVEVGARPVTIGPGGSLPLLAGEHTLRAVREGFDPATRTVTIEAGSTAVLEWRLVPNARSVILVTEPDGVEVTLDGTWVGRTERTRPEAFGVGLGPAQLLLENLPLGEHTFELSKACYRTERRRDFLDVDLMSAAPKRYDSIRMVAVRATLAASGGPVGARVLVDGEQVGRLPLEPVEVCPGSHEVEVRRAERRIRSGSEEFVEGRVTTVSCDPRPNVVVVGSPDWPPALASFRGQFNEISGPERLPVGDLSEARTWDRSDLPRDADLVLARRQAPREGVADEWYVYSPILEVADRFEPERVSMGRPRWATPSWGLWTADSDVGGPVRVVGVTRGGVADAAGVVPGDRISSVGGAAVESTRQLRRILAAASWKAPLTLEWLTADGSSRRAELEAVASPRLEMTRESTSREAVRAAWALAESVGEGEWADAARANLALAYSAFGRHEAAKESWRRVGWESGPGIARGTAQYYLGSELQLLGQEEEAIRALSAAAASSSTVVDAAGPRVAPAARDRLADLGVSVETPGQR